MMKALDRSGKPFTHGGAGDLNRIPGIENSRFDLLPHLEFLWFFDPKFTQISGIGLLQMTLAGFVQSFGFAKP